MKCIYCEENETKSVLLCYGCQVDLFPLVSAWAYCGVCGKELPDNSTICPHCAVAEFLPVSRAAHGELPPVTTTSEPPPLPAEQQPQLPALVPEPPVTPEEIKAARRFQWLVRAFLALIWLGGLLLFLWWYKSCVSKPDDGLLP